MSLKSRSWKAGALRAGAVCAAALALVLAAGMAPAAEVGSFVLGAPTAVAGNLREADARGLGLPPSAARAIFLSKQDSASWSQVLSGLPRSAGVAVAAYEMRGVKHLAAGVGWASGACRVVLPTRKVAREKMAAYVGVNEARALELKLDELVGLHEMGHCAHLAAGPEVSFDLPGLSAEESRKLSEAIFTPAMQALDKAGEPSRMWGEAFADAYMAVERLARGDAAGPVALALVARARLTDASRGGDGNHVHGAGETISLALSEASRWAGMNSAARLAGARQIASMVVIDALAQAPAHEREALFWELGSEGIARAAIEDGAARWIQARGEAARYEAFDPGEGAGAWGESPRVRAMGRLMSVAKDCLNRAARAEPGFGWRVDSNSALARANRVVEVASTDPEFEKAVAALTEGFPEAAWRKAESLAGAKPLWRMGLAARAAGELAGSAQRSASPSLDSIERPAPGRRSM